MIRFVNDVSLNLSDLHFPKNHIYNSIFNRNKIEVSYSCMQNMKPIINNHNMTVLNNTAETEKSCNSTNRNNCPLENDNEMRTFQHNQKEMLSLSNWKVRNNFMQRRQFIEQKVRISSSSSPFYGMIVKTRSYVLTEIFLAIFPLRLLFWPAWLMFCIKWCSRLKSGSSKQWFHWRILRVIFAVNAVRKWRHPFVWIVLKCIFFVIR